MTRRPGCARAVLSLALVAMALPRCAPSQPAPGPRPAPSGPARRSGAPLFTGEPPARLVARAAFFDVDPSGAARCLVRAAFRDAAGNVTVLASGGNVDFHPSSGTAQWQTRLRFGGPAAIVSFVDAVAVDVRVHADVGVALRDARVRCSPPRATGARVTARALGPHAVWLGWFPRVAAGTIALERRGPGRDVRRSVVAAPASGVHDAVEPGAWYRYAVTLPRRGAVTLHVHVPADFGHARGPVRTLAGKGVWLSFSPDPSDPDGYPALSAARIVARLRAAGIRSLALRVAYGPFREITARDAPQIDALLDAAAAAGIAPLAWTVPRSLSFDDLRAAVDAAAYRTRRGTGFVGLAVDLERGEEYLGDGRAGYRALATYLHELRAALGPRTLLEATVEDPALERLTENDYPFLEIAREADVLQPMVYWHAVLGPVSPRAAALAVARSYAAARAAAGRAMPLDIGLQASAQGTRGGPSPVEIAAALRGARRAGALGATFFDWSGMPPAAWRAIGRERW